MEAVKDVLVYDQRQRLQNTMKPISSQGGAVRKERWLRSGGASGGEKSRCDIGGKVDRQMAQETVMYQQ